VVVLVSCGISVHVGVFFKKKSTIYYTGRGGSPCLLGAGCEPMTLTAGGQGITNMAGGFTTMPSHLHSCRCSSSLLLKTMEG